MVPFAGRVGVLPKLITKDGLIRLATKSVTGVVKVGSGLSVSSGTVSVSDPIPAHTAADADKVLAVDSNNKLIWKTLN